MTNPNLPCFRLAGHLPPIEEITSYIRRQRKLSAADLLARADREKRVLIQPRCGAGDHLEMINILDCIDRNSDADFLTLTIDSHTRLEDFDLALHVLGNAPENLNGYPLVAHGYEKAREIDALFRQPIQVRHGSPDGRRLFAESLAGGLRSFEGGGISYNLPYCKSVPLEKSLRDWREIDQLAGYLTAEGIVIDREFFGSLTGVLVPPAIALSVVFLEAIMAADAGCRCLCLAYPQGGNLIQDTASLLAIRQLADRYLPKSVQVYPVLHQFMGVFPRKRENAENLLFHGGVTGRLGRATKIISKTYQEAIGIPDPEVNAAGIRQTRLPYSNHWLSLSVDQGEVDEEIDWIVRETRELIDPILNEPDRISAIVRACENGWLDIPFPANPAAQGKVMPVRSEDGAIRYAHTGALPFSRATLDRNQRLTERAVSGKPLYQAVRESILHFAD